MRYFVECGPSRRLERRSFVRTCLMRSRLRVCRSESVLCRMPLRESFASDARCHPTRLHLPSMSLASICRSLMRYCAESGGPLDDASALMAPGRSLWIRPTLMAPERTPLMPQSRSPLMAPGRPPFMPPHSLGDSWPLSLNASALP